METLDPSPLLFLTLFPEAMDDCLYLRLQSLSSGLALLQVSGNLIRLNYFPGPQSRTDKRVQESRKAGAVEILKYTRPKPFNPMSSAFDPRGS